MINFVQVGDVEIPKGITTTTDNEEYIMIGEIKEGWTNNIDNSKICSLPSKDMYIY